MSWDRVEANWTDFRGNVKQKWGKLTDDDLETVGGRRDELAARIEKHYGVKLAEAHQQIDEWLTEPGVLDDWNDRRAILDM